MVTLPISAGLPRKPSPRTDGAARRRRASAGAWWTVATLALAPLPVIAVDLLPPHEAFALSARALDASTLEARFNVVDGYYLYRDKLKFNVSAPTVVGVKPELPAGKMKHDEFFGDSETYRGLVASGVTEHELALIRTSAAKRRALGSAAFCEEMERLLKRSVAPRDQGRPGKEELKWGQVQELT